MEIFQRAIARVTLIPPGLIQFSRAFSESAVFYGR